MTARLTAITLLSVFFGCTSVPPAKKLPATRPAAQVAPVSSSTENNPNTDPCAMRLHDLCGPLLLYYATHQQLPARLEELLAVPGFELSSDLTCPASGKPYRYTRSGLPTKGTIGHVIIYDATPAHAGQRWAIAVKEPTANEPLVAKVIALPDAFFTATPQR